MKLSRLLTAAVLVSALLVTAGAADAGGPGDPRVFFKTPKNGTTITEPIQWGSILVRAKDTDIGNADGDGIARVRLIITDRDTGERVYLKNKSGSQYGFVPDLPDGNYRFRATAFSTPAAGGTLANASIDVTVDIVDDPPPPPTVTLDLSLDRFRINQAVPTLDTGQAASDRISPVAGRGGLARAFVTANEQTDQQPTVEMHWRRTDGTTGTVALSGPPTAPTQASEGNLASTYHQPLAGDVLRPGLEVYVVVDPQNEIAEVDETNNRWPASGWADADVADIGDLAVTWVPVVYNGITGDIDAGNLADYEDRTMRMMPIPGIDSQIHEPIVFTGNLSTGEGWEQLVEQIALLKEAEGSSRAYHAIVRRPNDTGIAGIGFIGYEAAVSFDASFARSEVVAHEFGHNFGRRHSPCGGPAGLDPQFPYPGARIGTWGYDMVTETLIDPNSNVRDLMAYCDPSWISDYTFDGVLADRLEVAGFQQRFEGSALRVAGTVDDGVATIGPAFALSGGGVVPAAGDYSVVGVDDEGNRLFEVPFTAHRFEVLDTADAHHADHDHEHDELRFSLSVPLDAEQATAVVALRIELDGELIGAKKLVRSPIGLGVPLVTDHADGTRTVTWDAADRVGVVRDQATGEILAIGDAGTATFVSGRPVELVLTSSGVEATRISLD